MSVRWVGAQCPREKVEAHAKLAEYEGQVYRPARPVERCKRPRAGLRAYEVGAGAHQKDWNSGGTSTSLVLDGPPAPTAFCCSCFSVHREGGTPSARSVISRQASPQSQLWLWRTWGMVRLRSIAGAEL